MVVNRFLLANTQEARRPTFRFKNCIIEEKMLIKADGAVIRYKDIKPTTPFDSHFAVLMSHGWLCNSDIFTPTIAGLIKFRIIAVETRGHGGSTIGTGTNDSNYMERILQDNIDILEREKIDATAIIGHSMGGLLALDLALTYKDWVKCLVLICGPYTNPVKTSVVRDIPGMGSAIKALSYVIERHPLVGPTKDIALRKIKLLERWAKRILHEKVFDAHSLSDQAFARLYYGALDVDVNNMFIPLRAMIGIERELGDLKEIPQPALILTGDKDWLVLSKCLEEAATYIPKSDFRVLAGKAHVLTIEAPIECARLARNFIMGKL